MNTKRQIQSIFIILLFLLSSLSFVHISYGLNINEYNSLVYELESEQITINHIDNKTEIIMKNFGVLTDPEKPKLPSKIFYIGIPPEKTIISTQIIELNKKHLSEKYKINNAQHIININISKTRNEEMNSDFSTQAYPKKIINYLGQQKIGIYNYAKIRFNPVQYYLSTKEVVLYESVKIRFFFEETNNPIKPLKTNEQINNLAMNTIENYDTIQSYYDQNQFDYSPEINYIIITTNNLYDHLTSFKTWKNNHGYSVKIINTSWINEHYNGIDLEEKIRHFLQNTYIPWGIEYVLIIGKHDTIPMRTCYPENYYNGASTVLTDFYYADLSGDWDSDGDGYYGEMQDAVDFSAEINVGRIPFDNPNVVTQILNKTISFQKNKEEWKKNSLLLGSYIWFDNYAGQENTETDGAVLMEKIWDDIMSQNDFTRTTMYEKEGVKQSKYPCDYPLNNQNVRDIWSTGQGIVSWTSHGTVYSLERMVWKKDNGDDIPYTGNDEIEPVSFFSNQHDDDGNDVLVLNDQKPSIVFAAACDNAKIKYPYDYSLAESLLEHGAVIFIGSTEDAYGPFNWNAVNDGGIESISYLFFKYFLKEYNSCSQSLNHAKTEYSKKYMGLEKNWWDYQNLYTVCLFGDPSISYQEEPEIISISGPTTVKKGKENDYVFKIADYQNDLTFLQIDWGDGNITKWIGPSINGSIEKSYQWQEKGEMSIKARAKDEYGWESDSKSFHLSVTKSNKIEHHFYLFHLIRNHLIKLPFFNHYFFDI